jgi:hypothetical protein
VTRAQFIHQYVLDACAHGQWDDNETMHDAEHVAHVMEKFGMAPWDLERNTIEPETGLAPPHVVAERQYWLREGAKKEREVCAKLAVEYSKHLIAAGTWQDAGLAIATAILVRDRVT